MGFKSLFPPQTWALKPMCGSGHPCLCVHTHTPGLKEEYISVLSFFIGLIYLSLRKEAVGALLLFCSCTMEEAGRISAQQTQTLERSQDLLNGFLRPGSEVYQMRKVFTSGSCTCLSPNCSESVNFLSSVSRLYSSKSFSVCSELLYF